MSSGDDLSSLLPAELASEQWVDSGTYQSGTVRIAASGIPDLRTVADSVDSLGIDDTTVVVTGDTQEWTVGVTDGEVVSVERTEGTYTVRRTSTAEQLLWGLGIAGFVLALSGALTAVGGFVVETPLGFVDSVGVVAVGGVLFGIGAVGSRVAPGATTGPRTATPGEGIDGFDRLDDVDQAALVAFDDVKTERNSAVEALRQRGSLSERLSGTAFSSYLFALAFINWGGVGVLALGAALGARKLLAALGTSGLVDQMEPLDSERAQTFLSEIHGNSDHDERPALATYGDRTSPVHESVPFAVPRTNTIVVPQADANRLRDDELRAVLAHEYKHIVSHYPGSLGFVSALAFLLPGFVVLFTGLSPTPVQFGVGLFLYFASFSLAIGLVVRRWEWQADAFATDHAPPLGLARALTRLTDRPTLNRNDQTVFADDLSDVYSSHPIPHERVASLVETAVGRG